MGPSLDDFSFVLCPGNRPNPQFKDIYQKIYACWYSVWSEAFSELGVTSKMASDAFTRQDLIGATFYKDQCIGMFFIRWADAERMDFKSDSYFKIWSEEHLAALCSRGPNILVSSNLTVHPDARGTKLGLSGKDLVIGMTVQTFLNSKADAMTGAMRVDRGANRATARWGSSTIAERVACDYGADNTELVGFFKDDIAKSPRHELQSFSENLWNKRMIISRVPCEYEFINTEIPHKSPKVA